MGSDIRSHRDLKIWQLGMEMTEAIYSLTSTFPADERFGLTSQLRRAAASVPANIAEGNGRDSLKDYLRHLSIAMGSLCEIETFLQLAIRLRFSDESQTQPIAELLSHEGRMIRGLQKSLRSKLNELPNHQQK